MPFWFILHPPILPSPQQSLSLCLNAKLKVLTLRFNIEAPRPVHNFLLTKRFSVLCGLKIDARQQCRTNAPTAHSLAHDFYFISWLEWKAERQNGKNGKKKFQLSTLLRSSWRFESCSYPQELCSSRPWAQSLRNLNAPSVKQLKAALQWIDL